tara:strand:+ start:565 stop:1185 length:621 start_codon:yes stop_codon:yes gene_type:complete
MAFATIDVTKGITGTIAEANLPTIPVTKGGTGLTSGTTDQFLKFTGSTTLASAADNAGAIKQIVHASQTGQITTGSTSYVWTDISASITLQSTSNDVLVFCQFGGEYHSAKSSGGSFRLFYKEGSAESSGGTNLSGWNQVCTSPDFLIYGGTQDMAGGQGCYIAKETRISNTNAHTFQVAFKTRSSDNFYPRHGNDAATTITLMEI